MILPEYSSGERTSTRYAFFLSTAEKTYSRLARISLFGSFAAYFEAAGETASVV